MSIFFDLFTSTIETAILNSFKNRKGKNAGAQAENYARYNTFSRIMLVFSTIVFTGFSIWAYFEKWTDIAIFGLAASILSLLGTFYVFSFSVRCDGPLITATSMFRTKEFLRRDIREIAQDTKGGLLIKFANGKIHVESFCTGMEELKDYLYNAYRENSETIGRERGAKLNGGFWCKSSLTTSLLMLAGFIFFTVLAVLLVFFPDEGEAAEPQLVGMCILLQLVTVIGFFGDFHTWIKVLPNKKVLRCYRLFFRKEISFESIHSMRQTNENYETLSFYNKKGKLKNIRIYLSLRNSDYLINLLIEQVFGEPASEDECEDDD